MFILIIFYTKKIGRVTVIIGEDNFSFERHGPSNDKEVVVSTFEMILIKSNSFIINKKEDNLLLNNIYFPVIMRLNT